MCYKEKRLKIRLNTAGKDILRQHTVKLHCNIIFIAGFFSIYEKFKFVVSGRYMSTVAVVSAHGPHSSLI